MSRPLLLNPLLVPTRFPGVVGGEPGQSGSQRTCTRDEGGKLNPGYRHRYLRNPSGTRSDFALSFPFPRSTRHHAGSSRGPLFDPGATSLTTLSRPRTKTSRGTCRRSREGPGRTGADRGVGDEDPWRSLSCRRSTTGPGLMCLATLSPRHTSACVRP